MNTIIIQGSELVVMSTAAEALKLRNELLAEAKAVPLITTKETAAQATETLRALRSFYKTIESGREAAKAPVLAIGRKIDAFAYELHHEISMEGERLGRILGAFNVEQERIAEQKRVAAQAEERRIREEAARIEREAREDWARKERAIAQEAEEKSARARTEAGRERAAQEAEKRRLEIEETSRKEQQARDDEEARRVAETRQSLAVATAKPEGTATRQKISYEITSIVALYEAAPYLVTLTENKAALLSALKGLHGEQKLPGVRHWKEAVTITRGL